jgi:hypothetical protein
LTALPLAFGNSHVTWLDLAPLGSDLDPFQATNRSSASTVTTASPG